MCTGCARLCTKLGARRPSDYSTPGFDNVATQETPTPTTCGKWRGTQGAWFRFQVTTQRLRRAETKPHRHCPWVVADMWMVSLPPSSANHRVLHLAQPCQHMLQPHGNSWRRISKKGSRPAGPNDHEEPTVGAIFDSPTKGRKPFRAMSRTLPRDLPSPCSLVSLGLADAGP